MKNVYVKCACRHNKSSSVWNLKPVLKSDFRLGTVWDLDTDLRFLTGSWIFLYEWVIMKNNTVLFFPISILSNCFLRKAIENNLNREWPIEYLFGKKNKPPHIFEKKNNLGFVEMRPHNNVASSSMVCDLSCFIYMVTEYLRKIFPKDFLLRCPFIEHNEVRWCTWWQNHHQFLKWGTVWKMAMVLISPYSVRMRENTDQKNSLFDTFHAVENHCIQCFTHEWLLCMIESCETELK